MSQKNGQFRETPSLTKGLAGNTDIVLLAEGAPAEADWVQQCLAPKKIVTLPPSSSVPVYPGALYLYSNVAGLKLDPAFLDQVKAAGGCGLVHVGDEYYRGDFTAYASFDFVIRMMTFEAVRGQGVFALPLGVSNNLGPVCRTRSSERPLGWMFAGDWKADRHVMAQSFKALPNGLLSLPRSFRGETGISRSEYIKAMASSAFSPCPSGNVCIETLRPYEALHLGAIPLLPKRGLSDPYRDVLGRHPLPTFEDWRSAARFAEDMLAKPAALDQLQAECLDWWNGYQHDLQQRLAAFVAEGQAGVFRKALTERFSKGISRTQRLGALLAQQNLDQTIARARFHAERLTKKLTTGKELSGRWSLPVQAPNTTADYDLRPRDK